MPTVPQGEKKRQNVAEQELPQAAKKKTFVTFLGRITLAVFSTIIVL